MISIRIWILRTTFFAFFFCTPNLLHSQQREVRLLSNADRFFNEGNLEEAVKTYDQLIREFPASPIVITAKLNRGLAQFQLGDFDSAVTSFKEVAESRGATAEVVALAQLNIGKALAASAQKKDSTQRTAALSKAEAELTKALSLQLSTDQREEALYWRALTRLLSEKPADALEDVKTMQSEFLKSGQLRIETRFLQGIALAASAAKLRSEGKSADAAPLWEQSRQAFEQAINEGRVERPGLANDAIFQIGEVLTNVGEHDEAINYFRRVEPTEGIIKDLERRRDNLREQFRRQQITVDQLRSGQERINAQLAALAERPDPVADAMSKIAFNLVQAGRHDQARVVLNHIEPFIKSDNLKKFVHYVRTISFALQGIPDLADVLATSFREKYPKDPLGENLGLLVGTAYLGERQPEKALPILEQSLVDYPNSRFAQETLRTIGQALAGLGRIEEATKRINEYVSKNPGTPEAQLALLSLGEAVARSGKLDDGLKTIREVLANAKTEAIKINCSFLIAQLLEQARRIDDAVNAYLDFAKNFPKAEQTPSVILQAGRLLDQAGKRDKARELYQRVISEYKTSEAAPFAQQAIATQHMNAKPMEAEEAIKAFQVLIDEFPNSPLVNNAKFFQGGILERQNKLQEAIDLYRGIISSSPGSPIAADAQLAIGRVWTQRLSKLGSFMAIKGDPELEKQWGEIWDTAFEELKTVLFTYPDSVAVNAALNEILRLFNAKTAADLMSCEDVANALGQVASDASAKITVALCFARAAQMQACGDAKGALEIMKTTYGDGNNIRLTAEELQRFGIALLDADDIELAAEIFRRLGAENPRNPAAQAAAGFGEVAVAVKKRDLATARSAFAKVDEQYSWSPMRHRAAVVLASLLARTEPQAAVELLNSVIAARTREPMNDIIMDAMFAAGEAELLRGRSAEAAGYYEMVHARFFTGGGERSVKGLLRAGELYASLPDKKNEACRVYATFLRVYGSDPAAEEVKQKRADLQCP
jgi:TolA-binding protein